jgi:membrane fusion protein (multidrug efflux system)
MTSLAVELPKARAVPRRQLVFAAAFAAVAVAAVWFAHRWWTVSRFLQSTDDAYVGGEVTVIAPRIAGFIAKVEVTDNQLVNQGDLLVKLDDRDVRAALAKTRAAVQGHEATLVHLEATRRLQLAMIAQAEASVTASDAETVRARDDQARYQKLTAEKVVPLQSSQRADAEYKQAVAFGTRSRAVVEAAQRQLTVIDAQKQKAQADRAGAIADRDAAELNLSYTELRAPIDGVVGNRSARAGAYAPIGAQLLAVVPAQGLWVDANFKENQLAHLRPGMAASVEADVMPGQVLHGRVQSLSPATGAQFSVLPAENATGNFTKIVQRVPVRIQLEGDPALLARLRPGLSVTAEVDERP